MPLGSTLLLAAAQATTGNGAQLRAGVHRTTQLVVDWLMLKTALLIVAAASSSTTDGGGCSFCGHLDGEGDRVYERDSELLIVCANGGVVANLTKDSFEGTFDLVDVTHGRAIRGGTTDVAFQIRFREESGAVTPELGMQPWNRVTLDEVALDHADVLCSDLEARDWWQ